MVEQGNISRNTEMVIKSSQDPSEINKVVEEGNNIIKCLYTKIEISMHAYVQGITHSSSD